MPRPLPLRAPRARPEEPEHPFAGQLDFQGLTLDIETRAGTYRRGTAPDGTAWKVLLPAHYGEVRGTKAVDGDPVDVFVGPNKYAPFAWVVQAKRPGTKQFDEPKCMLGFDRRKDALQAFRASYDVPGFILSVVKWPMPALVEALKHPKLQAGRLAKKALWATLRKAGEKQLVLVKPHTRQGKPVKGHRRKVKKGRRRRRKKKVAPNTCTFPACDMPGCQGCPDGLGFTGGLEREGTVIQIGTDLAPRIYTQQDEGYVDERGEFVDLKMLNQMSLREGYQVLHRGDGSAGAHHQREPKMTVVGYRAGYPNIAPLHNDNARFGPAYYYASNRGAAEAYQLYRPDSQVFKDTLHLYAPFDADDPDTSTEEWQRLENLVDQLELVPPSTTLKERINLGKWNETAFDVLRKLLVAKQEPERKQRFVAYAEKHLGEDAAADVRAAAKNESLARTRGALRRQATIAQRSDDPDIVKAGRRAEEWLRDNETFYTWPGAVEIAGLLTQAGYDSVVTNNAMGIDDIPPHIEYAILVPQHRLWKAARPPWLTAAIGAMLDAMTKAQGKLFVKGHFRDGRWVKPHYRHYRSGSSRKPDIEAYAHEGIPIGVVAHELTPKAFDALFALPEGTRLFVDSGAFSELKGAAFNRQRWEEVFHTYRRILRSSRALASFVAPDKVGDQEETLRRLAKNKDLVQGLLAEGYSPPLLHYPEHDSPGIRHPEVLVPLQQGDIPLERLWPESLAMLDLPAELEARLVPSVPANKEAWPHKDIVRWLATQPEGSRVHLLGIGPSRGRKLLEAIEDLDLDLDVSIDSNEARSRIGRTRGGKGGDITKAQDRAEGDFPTRRYHALRSVLGAEERVRTWDAGIARAEPGTLWHDLLQQDRADFIAEWERATGRTWEHG